MIPLGPTATLEHWLEPVLGAPTARVAQAATPHAASVTTEELLIGLAVLVAIAGIAFAWFRLKPDGLVPKRDAARDRIRARSRQQVLRRRGIRSAIVNPTYQISTRFLWRFIDAA
jgi:hypothetical protein